VFNTQSGSFETLAREACAFGYRDSIFIRREGKKYVITAVTYTLSKLPMPKVAYRDLALLFGDATPAQIEIREAVMKIRAGKFPNWHEVGTAGSFFKNPVISKAQYENLCTAYPELPGFLTPEGSIKVPLGWVLDKVLNLRGYTEGNVSTYKDQALVIVAEKNATAREIEHFANDIIKKIKNEIGIDVEWEVTKIK
jgi:UDP-N-acetylmuramate dehydrogenase